MPKPPRASARSTCWRRRGTRQAYRKFIYVNEVDKGGHFAAWEQPDIFTEEVRAAFRSVR